MARGQSNPAPGYRDAGNEGGLGALNGVGYGGFSWSSTVGSTNDMSLGFHVAWLDPSYGHNRGRGFPLRCLSE